MKAKHLAFLLFLYFPSVLFGQIKPMDIPPFKAGEEIQYHAIYQWGFIEIKAGKVQFNVDTITHVDQSCFYFRSIGNSIPKYDWIYKVRDTFKSIVVKDSFRPIYYERNTNEGDLNVLNKTYFEANEERIDMELYNSDKGSSFKSIPYEAGILDLQTAVYYARLLSFENAMMGDEYTFKVIIDGERYDIPIRYEGKENIELDDYTYSCYRISTQVIEGTIFKSHETIKIWVTDDGRQIPVKVEAPIIVGVVKAELIENP